MSAFEGLTMASIPPAKSSSEKPYNVFINHYGQDTKDTVAKIIYDKLDKTGVRVFLDKKELELGDFFPRALEEAICSASHHIAIFSINYAKSPWCLAELALMLQTGAIFIPVFYHVEPCTLRWVIGGKGVYADAFNEYKTKNRYSEKLESWRSALHNASFYTGKLIDNQCNEEEAVTNVVHRILKDLKKVTLDVAKHAVGLDELERDFQNKTSHQSGPIQIVGIWGMGGAGKTTLAKYLYNEKCFCFKKSSFLFDVREAARKELLHDKQKELLKDLDEQKEFLDVKNVDHGKEILRSRLKSLSVLIVLDDVDHTNQLDALLPETKSLGHGSLIIVTTRDNRVLTTWGISTIYKIPLLNPLYAEQLFCQHAFGQPSPFAEFKELAQKFINACHSLPLSLVVFGSHLYGESSQTYWQSELEKLSRIMPKDIKSKLKISYDALDKEEKEMFLDVACFFNRCPSSMVIAAWDGSGWNGLHSLKKLVNKCLVELDEKEENNKSFVRMHDHLQDLGRDVALQHSPYRVWSKDRIIKIKPQQKAIRIRGLAHAFADNNYLQNGKIVLNTTQGEHILELASLGLKIFIGEGYFINEECSQLLREMLFFVCHRFPQKNLALLLPSQKLRILQLFEPQNLEDLWECDEDAPLQLRLLTISKSYGLKKISHLGRLGSLETLEIYDCTELKTLPSLGEATSLKEIILKGCNKLEKIEGLEGLRSLETLVIYNCAGLKTLPSLGEATSLKEIILRGCNKLEKIERLEGLRSLQRLVIYYCTELNTLPSIAEATSLKMFGLRCCNKLEKIERLEDLKSLEVLGICDCPEVNTLPSLGKATSLKKFDLIRCNKLEKIERLEGLTSLERLIIYECTELSTLPSLAGATSLKVIHLRGCTKLEKIDSLKGLNSLEELRIHDCPELHSIPSLAELTCLEEFKLRRCHKIDKVEGLEVLRSLKKLAVHMCSMKPCMLKLEQSGRLKSLEVVAQRVVVEEPISEIQEVKICTRAVIDVMSLRNFFISFLPENVVEHRSQGGVVRLRMPESAGNAILICFIIHSIHPNLHFSISTDSGKCFSTKMSNGECVGMDNFPQESKWLWMGIFPQESKWLHSEGYEIEAYGKEGEEVKVKEGWLMRGTEQSIRQDFHRLSQRHRHMLTNTRNKKQRKI